MKRFVSILMSLFLVSITITGCGGRSTAGTGSTSQKDSLVFGLTAEPKSLDPIDMGDYTSYTLAYQVFDFLVEQKSDGTITPGLAQSWDISKDAKEVIFHLKKGVKFQNGDEMKADDVIFSINRAIKSPVTSVVTSAMDKAVVVDDYTVKLELKSPFSAVISCMPYANMAIVSKKAVEQDPKGFARHPVGTGAYKFKNWKIGDKIELEAFNDYYKGKPKIKNLTFKVIPDTNTMVVALQKGEVDVCDTPPENQKNILKGDKNLQYHETKSNGTNFLMFNNARGIFANKKVRQAVSCAIDKKAVIEGATNGTGDVAETLMGSACFGFPKDFKSQYQYDPERAKKLLTEAGYPNGFKVEMPTMSEDKFVKPTEVVQDQLKKVGIQIDIQKSERGVYLDQTRNKHDYQITLTNTNASYPDGDYLYPLFHSSYIKSGKNWVESNIPELDALLDKGRNSSDKTERVKIYSDVCKVMDDNMVVVPLYHTYMAIAANANLKGVVPSTSRRHFVYDYSWK